MAVDVTVAAPFGPIVDATRRASLIAGEGIVLSFREREESEESPLSRA
jgi:hypothetical protein